MIGLALYLGPLIKRFGKSYAADIFRANPRTGKSFIVLTDIAYYLIFFSYVLFTMSFQLKGGWDQTVGGSQLQHEVARIGGILLILGVLHGLREVGVPFFVEVKRPVDRPLGQNTAGIVAGVIRSFTDRCPEGMERVILLSDASWHLVKHTNKVTGFVGTGKKPTPLTQDEVDAKVAEIRGKLGEDAA